MICRVSVITSTPLDVVILCAEDMLVLMDNLFCTLHSKLWSILVTPYMCQGLTLVKIKDLVTCLAFVVYTVLIHAYSIHVRIFIHVRICINIIKYTLEYSYDCDKTQEA